MNLTEALQIATDIAREAGEMLRHAHAQGLQIDRKSSQVDLVTQFDKSAESLISQRLHAHFPDHNLWGEEATYAPEDSAYVWHIDPIDGTVNFAHRFPFYCISLALYQHNQPLLGVIYDPTRDECFSAIHGQGAYLTQGDQRVRLAVSSTEGLVNSLLATGFPYDRHTSALDNVRQFTAFLKRAQGIRRAGAAALDLAYVAAGRLDGYWEFKLNSYDVAAGVLLVLEAGGQVNDMQGQSFVMAPQMALVASNGRIQAAMLGVLATANAEATIE